MKGDKIKKYLPAIIQPNVCPTLPPCNEFSDIPPLNRSISST